MESKSIILFVVIFLFLISLNFASANIYYTDIYFTIPDSIYIINESILLKGYVYQSNYTNNGTVVSNSSALSNVLVNLTIRNSNGNYTNNYTFTTDSSGAFYSRSNYYTNSSIPQVIASSTAGSYYLRAEHIDANGNISFSEIEISVINKTLDVLKVSSEKAIYNPSESVRVNAEAVRVIGDRIIYVSNVSISGSLRNSTKDSLQTFNCTTGSNGKCITSVTAPSYGNYILEAGDFKAFSSFSVVPFSYNIYMKDDLGKSFKNIFASGEQAKIEVKINNASDSDTYTFSGYIADSAGNSIKSISSTTLNFNNSFTNTFLFTIDTSFSYATYSAHLTITKTGDGSISSLTSFQVQDWMLSVNKKEVSSGFEYEFSAFPNQTIMLEALPTYRSNGSVVASINSSSFNISLKDSLNNVFSSTNANWNASCGKSGCYEFYLTSPLNTGQYILYATLSYSGDSQTDSKIINIINGVVSAQSTDKDGNIKELFGANEYAYLSLSAYNLSSSLFNLTDAEIFIVSYMNGSEFSYTQVNYAIVNTSNSVYEWAWNSSLQRIKLDVPKAGGLYNVFIFGNNRTLGAIAKFIVNPYDVCSAAKDTAGTANYYAWQFKTSDTIYFEVKINQANNPLGKATALNSSTNSSGNVSYGKGAQCTINTQQKQVVNNATITLIEVMNLESGALQNINTTDSTCQASDSSGAYTCTVKPRSKWDGGQNIVKFNIQGQDGTSSIFYSMFEAKAFYLYGWSNVWQNNPSSNITLNLYMYEAGSGWWSGYGSSGISGSVTVKRVEYQGRDGEWLWPPVDSGYNISALNSSSISGSMGTISMPASYASGGVWKTGYYRVVLQATTSSGDTDYGYAWFGVKLWDVYGQPIECTSSSCNYKSYFNSKENISLYITINKAGDYNWWSGNYGGRDIYGNVTVGIKKIQDCRKWPCKDLNSSQYQASRINVNESSPGYWYANTANQSRYIIQINSTTGTWGTGWYSVVLDVNGTDTGYAWFNTIAFYVETQPTDINGSNYKYSIKNREPMWFNVTTTKSYKWYNYYGGARYNASDYINTTLDDAILRAWDQITYQSKEYNYPEDFNITPTACNGNCLINITFLNRTTNTTINWPSGYYWGELTLKNSENETSTGWLWFNVQPFRVQLNTLNYQYEFDSDQCVNSSIYIYDPDWYSSSVLAGNYSITSVYENIWGGYGNSQTTYTNYTNSSFNGSTNIQICPNNNSWSSGSWGGYHYLNIVVTNNQSESQNGWLSFRTVPFRVSWGGSIGNVRTNSNINTTVSLTRPSTGAATSGRLTKLYQWRYDNNKNTREEYVFAVGNSTTGICYSNVSGQCTVNGTQAISVYAPSGGWRVGWNYIQAEWTSLDGLTKVDDWSGISFEGREVYSGWFDSWWYDGSNYQWKYYIAVNENITIKLNVRDTSYNYVNVSISNVEYAYSGENCWSEWCRSYTTATFSITNLSTGQYLLNIKVPSTNWTKGYYAIRATVSGSGGTATITGGNVRVKDFTAPNLTISSPLNNANYSNNSLTFSATTSETSQCYVYIVNYDNFYNWYCWNWNATSNSSNSSSAQLEGSCNYTRYSYNGSSYYYEYVYNNWHYIYNNGNYSYPSTYLTTSGRSHSFTFDTSAMPAQAYGIQVWCYDDDWNSVSVLRAFRINNTA